MILGVPIYRDYVIIHNDEQDGPGHMTFKYGFGDNKLTPEANWKISPR